MKKVFVFIVATAMIFASIKGVLSQGWEPIKSAPSVSVNGLFF